MTRANVIVASYDGGVLFLPPAPDGLWHPLHGRAVMFLIVPILILLGLNIVSFTIAAYRIRGTHERTEDLPAQHPISIVIPMCGLERFSNETLYAAFRLDWRNYELIFCVVDPTDPIAGLIDRARRAHPDISSQILYGNDRVSANPKLNNCVKGWNAAAHTWIVLADSNVLMPTDYLQRLVGGWKEDTGLVCSTPLGCRPQGFWANVECAFLNTHQARWQYSGEALGFGFAQGKSMLWRRETLDAHGGIKALSAEIAEDAAATKLINSLGLKVHLVASPFEQPLGRRTLQEVWSRQCRWARLRRVTFPLYFSPEVFLGSFVPLSLGILLATVCQFDVAWTIVLILVASYLPEIAFAAAKGWPLSWVSPVAMLTRDIMMPMIWLRSWFRGTSNWRGNVMTIEAKSPKLDERPAA